MGTQLPLRKWAQQPPPQFSAHVYCGQTVAVVGVGPDLPADSETPGIDLENFSLADHYVVLSDLHFSLQVCFLATVGHPSSC